MKKGTDRETMQQRKKSKTEERRRWRSRGEGKKTTNVKLLFS